MAIQCSGADSVEKHEPASDIDTATVSGLKALTLTGRLEKQTSADPHRMSAKCAKSYAMTTR